jgi:hypothetical protein
VRLSPAETLAIKGVAMPNFHRACSYLMNFANNSSARPRLAEP